MSVNQLLGDNSTWIFCISVHLAGSTDSLYPGQSCQGYLYCEEPWKGEKVSLSWAESVPSLLLYCQA